MCINPAAGTSLQWTTKVKYLFATGALPHTSLLELTAHSDLIAVFQGSPLSAGERGKYGKGRGKGRER